MTCIAWDGRSLAVDRQSTSGGLIESVKKYRVLPTGEVMAMCGHLDYGLAMFDWYEKGAKPEAWPEFQKTSEFNMLVVLRNGKVHHYQRTPFPIVLEDEFNAWGAGCDLAIGAMAMGASAREAVEVAARFNNTVGGRVDVFPSPAAARKSFSRKIRNRRGVGSMGGKNKPGREGKKPKGGRY